MLCPLQEYLMSEKSPKILTHFLTETLGKAWRVQEYTSPASFCKVLGRELPNSSLQWDPGPEALSHSPPGSQAQNLQPGALPALWGPQEVQALYSRY